MKEDIGRCIGRYNGRVCRDKKGKAITPKPTVTTKDSVLEQETIEVETTEEITETIVEQSTETNEEQSSKDGDTDTTIGDIDENASVDDSSKPSVIIACISSPVFLLIGAGATYLIMSRRKQKTTSAREDTTMQLRTLTETSYDDDEYDNEYGDNYSGQDYYTYNTSTRDKGQYQNVRD